MLSKYDPMYEYQLVHREGLVFRGSASAVREYLLTTDVPKRRAMVYRLRLDLSLLYNLQR